MDCLSDVLTPKAYVQDENGNLQIQVLDSAKFLIPRGYQASEFTPLLRGIEKEEIPQELINNLPGDCLAKSVINAREIVMPTILLKCLDLQQL